ncbi:hypothetical protein N9498_01105 [Porticoccaceae bacterium]|nr:hypothetical protein [Porticoccaceae bacterium]
MNISGFIAAVRSVKSRYTSIYTVSGYLGNAILLTGLSAQYDVVFVDEQAHYSVMDGIAIAGKPKVTFTYRNPEDLQLKLRTEFGGQ